MKNKLCTVIALALLLATLFAEGCAVKEEETTAADGTANATEADETAVPDDLPNSKFSGRTFRVLLQEGGQSDFFTENHEIAEPVHDAVFERNKNVEDRFDVRFEINVDGYVNVNNRIKNSVKSGADEYDLCFVHMVSGAELALDNDVLPFEKLPYIDLSKPWWDKSIKNGFSIRNNLMMLNGDISPFSFSITSCMYFNKTMFDRLDLEYPYELVKKGEWTLDKLIEYTKGITQDADGDGKITPDGSSDIYGLTSWHLDVPYSLYYAAGGMLVSKDQDDVPYYDPQLDRDTEIYGKLYDVIITNKAFYATDMANYNNVYKLFTDGRAMFLDSMLNLAGSMREMNDEFGIIPVPKLNKSQPEYKSFVNGASSMICVPATVKESDREYVSILIEGIASEAYRIVTPVLKENYLKRKVTRDADSAEMIDYIVRNRVFDMAYVNMYDGVGSYVRVLLSKGSKDISSAMKSYQKSAKRKIENIVKAFDKSLQRG